MKNKQDRTIRIIQYPRIITDPEYRYVNVPVNLLKGIFEDSAIVAQKILIFCVYQFAFDRLSNKTLTDRITLAGEFFQIEVHQNAYIMTHGRKLYAEWQSNNCPRGGIKLLTLHDLLINHKSEFDLIILCALIGLKSIIQHEPYKKTSFDALFARMAGFPSVKQAEGKVPENIIKYSSRHYRTKIIRALEEYWHLSYEADHTRGFYFSFKLNHEELCHAIQKQKLKKKHTNLEITQRKKDTRQKVKQLYLNRNIPS